MNQMKEWIPPNAPPSEEYWKALLRDGENGEAAPAVDQASIWNEKAPHVPRTSTEQLSRPSSLGHSTKGPGPEDKPTTGPAAVEDRWEEARRLMERGEVLELPVVGCNRGGVLVGWNGLRGFVPASHLSDLSPSLDKDERHADLRRLVGTKLPLKIIELDPERRRFVLSERATHVDESQRRKLLNTLCPGDICQGHVTSLCSFGAFVDLGGFEGLVHISELSWGRVNHPSDVLEPGQPVEVYVLNVDCERERVGLSTKRLQPDPWQLVEDHYQVGQIIEGTVTHVVNFGAFVQVEEGLEGLIHVSELREGNTRDPHNVVQKGDVVTAQVLNVDGERRRMGLQLQRVTSRK